MIVIAWGNFGARPKPPKRGSYCSCEVRDRPVEDVRGQRTPRRAADGGALDDGLVQLLGVLSQLLAAVAPCVVDGVEHAARSRACPGGPRAGSRCRRRRAARRGRGTPSSASRRCRSSPARPACRWRRRRVAPRGRPSRSRTASFITAAICGVLERLVGHDVAPVARRVARSTGGSACPRPGPGRTPLHPTGTSRPGCRRAGGDRGWSRAGAGSALRRVHFAPAYRPPAVLSPSPRLRVHGRTVTRPC